MNRPRGIAAVTLTVIAAALLCAGFTAEDRERPRVANWLCYYDKVFGPEIYDRFDLVVFDAHSHPPLPEAKLRQDVHGSRPLVLGYVSFGEVEENGPFWPLAEEKGFLVKENTFWGSWIVDITDPEWRKILLEHAVPHVIDQGFDGIFIDTLDSVVETAREKGGEEPARTTAAVKELIGAVRAKYPRCFIAMNRGLPLLPAVARDIDFVVAEDLYSRYDDGRGR
jgi:polysaccharide biosynthesis protein PelA